MGEFINKLAPIKEFTLDLLYPRYCMGCGVEGCFLCQRCVRKLPFLSPLNCPKCGLPLGNRAFCPHCQEPHLQLDSLHSVFRFEGFLRQAILRLKYNNCKAYAPVLAEQVYSFLNLARLKADAIIPVPLHALRLKERGFNQSSLIAKKLGKLAGIPVVDNFLIRTVNTLPQVRTSSREERMNNVKGAFACNKSEFSGNSVILFDDVCTTGATLSACAAALKEKGLKFVYGLSLAREI